MDVKKLVDGRNIGGIMKEVMILCGISLGLSFLGNSLSTLRIPAVGEWSKEFAIHNPGGRCKPNTVTGQFDLVFQEFQTGDALFIDARSRDRFIEGHIPGAISLPVGEAEEMLTEFMAKYPPELKMIIYCTGGDCYDSHDLSEILKRNGYQNLSVFSGGYEDWIKHEREIKTGEEP